MTWALVTTWPSASQMAREIGLKHESHATIMRFRKSIPTRHWPALMKAAEKRGITITLDDLVRIHIAERANKERAS